MDIEMIKIIVGGATFLCLLVSLYKLVKILLMVKP